MPVLSSDTPRCTPEPTSGKNGKEVASPGRRRFLKNSVVAGAAAAVLSRPIVAAIAALLEGSAEAREAEGGLDYILDQVQTDPDEPKYLDDRYVKSIFGEGYEYMGRSKGGHVFKCNGQETLMSPDDLKQYTSVNYRIHIPPGFGLFPGGKTIAINVDLKDFARRMRRFVKEWEDQRQLLPAARAGIFMEKNEEGTEIRVFDISQFIDRRDPMMQKLALGITQGILEPIEKLRALLLFVQQFSTLTDPPDLPDLHLERPAFPGAFLVCRGGECEDKSAMLASLALAIPEVSALGLELVYGKTFDQPSQRVRNHVLLGVRSGVKMLETTDYGMPRKTDGFYLLDPSMEVHGLIGYPPKGMDASEIKHSTRLS